MNDINGQGQWNARCISICWHAVFLIYMYQFYISIKWCKYKESLVLHSTNPHCLFLKIKSNKGFIWTSQMEHDASHDT